MEKSTGPGAVSEHVGRRVKELRLGRGWPRERLARLLSREGDPIGQNAIWKIEQDPPERKITVDELAALAHVFETTPADLMGWAPRPADAPLQPSAGAVSRGGIPSGILPPPSLRDPFLAQAQKAKETTLRGLIPAVAAAARLQAQATASVRLWAPLMDALDIIDAHGYDGDEGRARMIAEFGGDVPLVEIARTLQAREHLEVTRGDDGNLYVNGALRDVKDVTGDA